VGHLRGAGACPKVSDNHWGRGDRPVILVSWEEAKGYVMWVKRRTDKGYRLLTESEWEYAARAGNQGSYSFGDDVTQIVDYTWYRYKSDGKTRPVGAKKPNAFVLYDMHENVRQWVEDCYHDTYQGAPSDGSAWVAQCRYRVVRGGGWFNGWQDLRSAVRLWPTTGDRSSSLGFRVGWTLTP
jgi:formylglycine-generating enzyme required for sulfatase activity